LLLRRRHLLRSQDLLLQRPLMPFLLLQFGALALGTLLLAQLLPAD
jgi:hypothetical protein